MVEASVIVGSIALAGTAVAASIWNTFRRRTPHLTQEDLLPDPLNDDLQVVRRFTEEDSAGLKEAFGSSRDFVWILKDGDNLEGEDADDMASLTSYLMDFLIYIADRYGHIIKSVDKDGKYQGSLVLIPPVKPFLYKAYEFASIAHNGKPPSFVWDDASRKARFHAFTEREKRHHEVMHDCIDDHWNVLILGVAPSAQGKRVGSRLLQQAIHLGGDKPLFLDCHNGNVPYYEKHGFQVGKNYAFETPKGTSKSAFYYNAMRRDPRQ
mmetsp:Transcript_36209/g.87649  ORF Transcript_36209/g.87649 Transcript_36209/m.87649 type:complete len:266 (+) Transcript_36209:36-833(+)|eukprot:CAMPEP_0113627644 /NCGR_PEP_ID=MMETSP0017_2-20120614/14319_1 /TAXON_ID=2856 /ORGANISM="Cylindrotheca closterium" /LENGTH=265 /DNA_ID=CAMNT_0000537911 /DNA_START=17 /DNA_END=814 /DNA_ORIENTATION=+ /assembly_acc=CAM_ASM_000147